MDLKKTCLSAGSLVVRMPRTAHEAHFMNECVCDGHHSMWGGNRPLHMIFQKKVVLFPTAMSLLVIKNALLHVVIFQYFYSYCQCSKYCPGNHKEQLHLNCLRFLQENFC